LAKLPRYQENSEETASHASGGFFLLFDYVGADDSVRTQCLVLLGTITVVHTIWRAVGLLAARIELMHLTRDGRDNRVS
jgi:hypothetical protein